jgi:glycine cleavage system H lipoate-binding protein
MNCPFLRDTHVKYCRASFLRKMIVETPGVEAHDKCSTPAFRDCPAYRERPAEEDAGPPCPWLHQSLVQYCDAAPVRKFIPYSESPASRCHHEGHRYCDLYLSLARAGAEMRAGASVDGIHMPDWLLYTANHMWLDQGPDGSCHIGVDAFVIRVLGRVDGISFVTLSGVKRPGVVLTAGTVDVPLTFPNSMLITGTNVYLRANPGKLCADPYNAGWLFRAEEAPHGARRMEPMAASGAIRGQAVRQWLEQDVERLSRFIHARLAMPADGGLFAEGVLAHLDRDGALQLVNEFFAPHATWRAPQ